jgi:heme-degrading monooxygenase HmoA
MTLSQRRYILGLSKFDNMDGFESFESLQNNAIAAPP